MNTLHQSIAHSCILYCSNRLLRTTLQPARVISRVFTFTITSLYSQWLMPHIIRIQSNESGCGRKIPAWIFFSDYLLKLIRALHSHFSFLRTCKWRGALSGRRATQPQVVCTSKLQGRICWARTSSSSMVDKSASPACPNYCPNGELRDSPAISLTAAHAHRYALWVTRTIHFQGTQQWAHLPGMDPQKVCSRGVNTSLGHNKKFKVLLPQVCRLISPSLLYFVSLGITGLWVYTQCPHNNNFSL